MNLPSIFGILGALLLCQSSFATISKANLNTLRVAQVLFRHGSRSIDKTYPTDPYKDESYWAPGYSQLNNEGKLQAYNLGLELRERYDGFIKDTYDLKDLYVQSSDLSRTIQTAYSVLAGFYLPNERKKEDNETILDAISRNEIEVELPWKSVPVHSSPIEFDNILRQKADICPKYYNILVNNAEEYISKEDQEQVFGVFSKYAGVEVTNLLQFAKLYDALSVEDYLNMTLPAWTDSIYKTGLGQKVFSKYFPYLVSTTEKQKLRVGPLLQTLVNNMRKNETEFENEFVRTTNGQKKMYFLSGHDATIVTLMYTLGIYNGKRPSYCTAIIFELHQRNESDPQDLTVEVFYKNETNSGPYNLQIPSCGYPCSFKKFVEVVHPLIPENWQQECQIDQGSGTLSTGWIVAIILIAWIVLFLLLQFWIQSDQKCFSRRVVKNSYARLA